MIETKEETEHERLAGNEKLKSKDTIFIGYEVATAKKIAIEMFHTLITGQTQKSGKTTLLRAMASRAVEKGYKVLVFDTKTNYSDFQGFGNEIPICLRQTTDPMTIIGLLESIWGRKISDKYATLIRVSENAKTFEDVIRNAEALEEKSKVGFVRDACRVLIDLMNRLVEQTRGRETTAKLSLPNDINRMTINNFALEGQQMIVKTAFEDGLHQKKLVIILDEAFKFLPQKYRSACGKAIQEFVTQGAITGTYLWMATQFLATTSKDSMKAMSVKILGRQDHDTECQHTLDIIPKTGELKLVHSFIMRLKLGHFLVIADDWVKHVYMVPQYADKDQAKEVAKGNRAPEQLEYVIPVKEEEVKKLEAEKIEIKERPKPEPTQFITIKIPAQFTLDVPENQQTLQEAELEGWMRETEARLKALEEQVPSNVELDATLQQTKIRIKQSQIVKHVELTDEDMQGKIMSLASEGFFEDWHPLRETIGALEKHKWTATYTTVQKALIDLARKGLLSVKKQNREKVYSLPPNTEFI